MSGVFLPRRLPSIISKLFEIFLKSAKKITILSNQSLIAFYRHIWNVEKKFKILMFSCKLKRLFRKKFSNFLLCVKCVCECGEKVLNINVFLRIQPFKFKQIQTIQRFFLAGSIRILILLFMCQKPGHEQWNVIS